MNGFCYVGGEKIEQDKDFPAPEKSGEGSEAVTNWTKPLARMRELLTEISAKLPKVAEAPVAPTEHSAATSDAPPIHTGSEAESDDLPF